MEAHDMEHVVNEHTQNLHNVSGTTSEMRRKFPRDAKGAKNEWQAMIHHQHEMNQEIQKFEKELKHLRTKDLAAAHNMKIQQKIMEKETELAIKQNEADLMNIKLGEFKRAMDKVKADKSTLQMSLADNHEHQIDDKNRVVSEIKLRSLEEERVALAEAKRRLEVERQKEIEKMKRIHDNYNDDMARTQEKAFHDKMKDIENRQAYNKQMRENEMKQVLKEENYRNFFKLTAENHRVLGEMHENAVTSPQMQKDRKIAEFVDKGVVDENERKLRDEMNRIKYRHDRNLEMNHMNKDQMSHHEHIRDIERAEKFQRTQESLKATLDYQNYLRQSKEHRKNHQFAYKSFLDQQALEAEEKRRLNVMTKEEKKINADDLHAQKLLFLLINRPSNLQILSSGRWFQVLPILTSVPLVWDISNSRLLIAKLATFSLVKPMTRVEKMTKINLLGMGTFDGIAGIGPDQSLNVLKIMSNENERSKKHLNELNKTHENLVNRSLLMSGYDMKPDMPDIHQYTSSPIKIGSRHAFTNPPNTTLQPVTQSSVNLGSPKTLHNPVTNPMPYNIQNPYLLKEINRFNMKRTGLANIGTNIVSGQILTSPIQSQFPKQLLHIYGIQSLHCSNFI